MRASGCSRADGGLEESSPAGRQYSSNFCEAEQLRKPLGGPKVLEEIQGLRSYDMMAALIKPSVHCPGRIAPKKLWPHCQRSLRLLKLKEVH